MIAARAIRLTLALLLATTPVAISAQPVTDIAIGQTLNKKAGSKTEIYRFVGGSGTTIRATLATPGKAALILYTPAGEEMLTAQGNGKVTLDAILPLWDVFFIGVVRQNAAQPHSLKLTGIDPDSHLAAFALESGYSINVKDEAKSYGMVICWIEPGIKLRRTYSTHVEEVLIGRGGKEIGSWKNKEGRTGTGERLVHFEGQDIVTKLDSGKTVVSPLESLFASDPSAKYRGYLCEPQG